MLVRIVWTRIVVYAGIKYLEYYHLHLRWKAGLALLLRQARLWMHMMAVRYHLHLRWKAGLALLWRQAWLWMHMMAVR